QARQGYEQQKIEARVDETIREARLATVKGKLRKSGSTAELKAELLDLEQEQSTPTRTRYIVSDSTPEALHQILTENKGGVLVFRDDLGALFASTAREERSQERELLLSAWGGNTPFPVERIKRGSLYASAMCLSLFGTIQPDPLL